MKNIEGIITKGIGGFYYVETSGSKIYECKARGIFRKREVSPCVGDRVIISANEDGFSSIEEILERKNHLIRPPVSNIDRLFIVVSTCHPKPNFLVIDKMISIATYKKIEPILVISKTDLKSGDDIYDIYNNSLIKSIKFSSKTGDGKEEVRSLIKPGINVFTGNSGVGKSSLLNILYPSLSLKTGITSKKLDRGKHTTRHVELFKFDEDTYLADTPGFSMIDIQRFEDIKKEDLAECFLEFEPYINNCKFNSCSHTCEKGCAVIEALENGKIEKSRHSSYVAMYNELKEIHTW